MEVNKKPGIRRMIVDAHAVQPAGKVLETDVCIVGGGAAGITLAREFANAKFRVALLESGGTHLDSATQDLYAGSNEGRDYFDGRACRLRYFGGTTNHWGGWCLPLDPIDFETRQAIPFSGWPFDRSYLDPWYRRSQQVCQLGPFDYAPDHWGIDPTKVPPPFDGKHFRCEILQLSPPTRFAQVYAPTLSAARQLTVYLNANVVGLVANESCRKVLEARVATLDGHRFSVRAKVFVLATGGIENARLLLASGPEGRGLGNDRDLVGRFFMTHIQYHGGEVMLSDPAYKPGFDTGASGTDFIISGASHKFIPWIGISEYAMRQHALPNFKLRQTYALSPVHEAVYAAERIGTGSDHWDEMKRDLATIIRDLERQPQFEEHPAFAHEGHPADLIMLRCHSEQLPNPDSRVRLGDERDALGMRKIVIDWRLTAEDKQKAVTTVGLLGAEIGRCGLGRVRSWLTGDDFTWPAGMFGDQHHTGTTRMHKDPTLGVVDPNCAVHGIPNLYVAGSSLFPTSGAANPTLTIVALALRLADHIKDQLA
jgi:choline dehydrogenase-like flavoprotein